MHLYNSIDTGNINIKFKPKVNEVKMKSRINDSLNNTNVDIPNQDNNLTSMGREADIMSTYDGVMQT